MRNFQTALLSAVLFWVAMGLTPLARADLGYRAQLVRETSEPIADARFSSEEVAVTMVGGAWQGTFKGTYSGRQSWSFACSDNAMPVNGGGNVPFECRVVLKTKETVVSLLEVGPQGMIRRENVRIVMTPTEANSFKFRPLLFRVSEILILQSEGRNAFSPMLGWSPVLQFSRLFLVRAHVGAAWLRSAQDDSRFILLDSGLMAGVTPFPLWTFEVGGGLQSWLGMTVGTVPALALSVRRSFDPKLLHLIDGVFATYEHSFATGGDAHVFELGVQWGWR